LLACDSVLWKTERDSMRKKEKREKKLE
jgi:hypothetical protein